MFRTLLMLLTLSVVPVAFTQSIEVASCTDCKTQALAKAENKSASRMLLKARCTFPDGTLVAEQFVEIDASLSKEEKRAKAEAVCQPIMDTAIAVCDDIAKRFEALRSERRIAPPRSFREHELMLAIQKTEEEAPAYCK
jgi:hypothetical protein